MTWLPDSEAIWSALSEQPGRLGIYYAKEVIDGSAGVLLAQDSVRGDRHLLLRIPDAKAVTPDTKSRGVKLECRVLEGAEGGVFADFWCSDPGKQKLFGVMADEVLSRIAGGEGSGPAIAAQVLKNWRGLLGGNASRLLTFEEQAGLFAELIVLEELARSSDRALDAWQGPFKAPHDFVGTAGSVEVKATLSGNSVFIHGVHQLASPPHGILHLCVIVLSPTPAGESLASRISKTQAVVANDEDFFHRLTAAGYHVEDALQYDSTRFNVTTTHLLPVQADFPSITPSLLAKLSHPENIGRLEYELLLPSLLPRCLAETDVRALFASFLR